MTTAVDTNVFQALWSGTPTVVSAAETGLERASGRGALVISPVVYAELIASPSQDIEAIEAFLNTARIRVDWLLDIDVWQTAARAFRGYAQRRRTQERGPGPRRILADFLIGAHAVHHASALLTFDQGIYRAAFPSLIVLVPPAT